MTYFKRFQKSVAIIGVFLVLFAQSAALADELVITGNGNGADNEVTVQATRTQTTTQENEGNFNTAINPSSQTGENSASENNDETNVTTGNATTEVVLKNSVNENNLQAEACCVTPGTNVTIAQNGSEAKSAVTITTQTNAQLQQTNIAYIANTVTGTLTTGQNTADENTGNVAITTGDIFVSQTIVNAPVNINTSHVALGNSALPLVNIYGNGTGSIQFVSLHPREQVNQHSRNTTNILNNVVWLLETGKNVMNNNSGGSIYTGDITFISTIINNVNSNTAEVSCCGTPPVVTPTPQVSPPPQVSPTPQNPSEPGKGNGSTPSQTAAVLGASTAFGGAVLPITGSMSSVFLVSLSFGLFFLGFTLRGKAVCHA